MYECQVLSAYDHPAKKSQPKFKPEDFLKKKVEHCLGGQLSIISLKAFPKNVDSAQTSDFFVL